MISERKVGKIIFYVEKEHYKGFDPYDGLLSPLSRLNIPLYRLIFQQVVKRSGEGVRRILKIKKTHNPKGLALFLWAYSLMGDECRAKEVWNLLRKYSISTNGGVGFGYPFPWQSSVFYVPQNTPNVIVTSFVVFALSYAIKRFGWKQDLTSFIPFYERTLNFFKDDNGKYWLSYTPYDKLRIFNSSVLGALAYIMCGGKKEIPLLISETLRYYQRDDGGWVYGLDRPTMNYIDNIHTAYNLWGLTGIMNTLREHSIKEVILRGYGFYKRNLFTKNGLPKSRINKVKFDTHDVSVSIITFKIFKDEDKAENLMTWALNKLVNDDGSVFNGPGDKRVFMRWSVAWLYLSLVFEKHFPFTFEPSPL